MVNTGRSMRAGGVLPRLLLVVVLALGVFVMHTLGHPDGGSGSGMSHSAHRASAEMRPAPYGGDHGGGTGGMGGTAATGSGPQRAAPAPSAELPSAEAPYAAVPHAEARHAPDAPETKPRDPMTGMDMASLCVAVLGVWVLGALLRVVSARRSGPPPGLPVTAAATARLDPPSCGPDLTALSVLRI
ncbi:hypothetical protein HUF15_14025 [Streptomyces samsunensis]|uniref:hypothetical protein n=1 Tax=Streptomyces malaysiensis TaxID=92644 RepID=UPI0015834AA1|nr:hypothetical protein [Streptomyces samsunensis]NUH37867.1 hypothetical protein [Streptomyces samsunensis]